MRPSEFLITVLALLHTTLSQLTLDRQCWHEHLLSTVNLYSNLDQHLEFTFPIQPSSKAEDEPTPWSHPVTCTPVLPSLNSSLCIYTSTSFASGRGITIFTTPILSAHYASLPAFRNPTALNKQGINTPTNRWRTAVLPGKGVGMLATQPLKLAERITAYTPAFLAVLESDLSTRDREVYWRRAIAQLPVQIQREFLGLATVYGDERVRVQDVVKANTFQVDVLGVNHLAVWPESSRLNHECAPNAQYVIDTDLLTHHVRATRDIAEGEEITISYTTPFHSRAERANHLSSFGFTCRCARCVSPTSDQKLSQILALQAQLNDWGPTSAATPAMAERLIALHVEEGLEGFMDTAYGLAALAYGGVGLEMEARRYAELAMRAVEVKDGRGGSWGIWRDMLDEERGGVRGHWSWLRREGVGR